MQSPSLYMSQNVTWLLNDQVMEDALYILWLELSCGANHTKYICSPKARTQSFCFLGSCSKNTAHSVEVCASRLPLREHFQAGKICCRCHLSHPISQPDGYPSTWFVQQPSVALKCYTRVNLRCVFYCSSCRTQKGSSWKFKGHVKFYHKNNLKLLQF